jgi:hypothetical protein
LAIGDEVFDIIDCSGVASEKTLFVDVGGKSLAIGDEVPASKTSFTGLP